MCIRDRHKTAPQVIALRELTGKSNFTGMAFIGVRASESISRSEYDYVSLGEKHKGQYSCNPILEWNSAELYMYCLLYTSIARVRSRPESRWAGYLHLDGIGVWQVASHSLFIDFIVE